MIPFSTKTKISMNQLINTEPLNSNQEYFTVEEVMEILNISSNTLYRYFNRGVLDKVKFKNRNYIPRENLQTYLNEVFGEETL